MKKKIWTALCLTAFMTALLGMTAFAAESDEIHDGVYIEDIDVSGMTESEAVSALEDYVEELSQETLTLAIDENVISVSLETLGLTCTDMDEVVGEAMDLGKTGNIIKRYKERKDLEYENKYYELSWTLDEDLVSEYVNAECTQFDQEAVDATLTKDGDTFTVVEGSNGIVLDVDGAVDTLIDFIENEWDQSDGNVTLPVEIDYPQGTAEELSKVQDLLGSYTTSYSSSSTNRSTNIANGASLINGTVLYPGEQFSAYEAVEPFTEENGYLMAGSYLNGKTVDSMGGGICQVSTTLYNAVLRAELQVDERSGHSMTVSYVDPAADAAIAGTYKDLKFTNDTDAPIYIEAYTYNKTITFNIYGEETRASNRTIEFVSETISTTDAGTVFVADSTQAIGYYATESGHTGIVAELYKYVYIDGVESEVVKINKTTYQASARTVTVGVAGDEDLSEQLQAAVALQDEEQILATLAYCLEEMD